MKRGELVGSWKWVDSSLGEMSLPAGVTIMQLNADGTALMGSTEEATWEWVDEKHFKVKLVIAPQPGVPDLEDGAVDVQEYEIKNATLNRMELATFDYEF